MTAEAALAAPPPSPKASAAASVLALVDRHVGRLLSETPAFNRLEAGVQREMRGNLSRIAAYAAACARDIWRQSDRLGQRPMLVERAQSAPTLARAAANDFQPRAASQVADVAARTLRAISFPNFVADLIRGTFDAITRTTMQQLEAFAQLLRNVSKTVDQFMQDNISDDQARSWLAQTYPRHMQVADGRLQPRSGADELPAPDFQRELNVGADIDESSLNDTLVPAARRRLAEQRLQMLSTLVLMGVNRIVVTGGRIKATMGLHIDTSDSAFERTAEDVDARVAARGGVNMGFWSFEASASLAYVNSRRAGSDAEINTTTDLTAEVELSFKSDYMPVQRFANASTLRSIQGNTAVPEENPLPTAAQAPAAAAPARPEPRRRPREAPPALPPLGQIPAETRLPAAPIAPGALNPTPLTPPAGAGARSSPREAPAPTGDSGAAPSPAAPAQPAAGATPPENEQPAATGAGLGAADVTGLLGRPPWIVH